MANRPLEGGGPIERPMASHESPKTTKLYARTSNEITVNEVEQLAIWQSFNCSQLTMNWSQLNNNCTTMVVGFDIPSPEQHHREVPRMQGMTLPGEKRFKENQPVLSGIPRGGHECPHQPDDDAGRVVFALRESGLKRERAKPTFRPLSTITSSANLLRLLGNVQQNVWRSFTLSTLAALFSGFCGTSGRPTKLDGPCWRS